nr:MAG TPA: hypothetical protein [Caudoviricetes sp.]
MINIKDLKVGQKVVLVGKKYENNTHKPELDTFDKAEIVKVGRRYVTVSVGGYFKTFDSQEGFKVYYGYGYKRMKQGLYLSAQDYFEELKKEKLLKKIRDFFSYSGKQCDLLRLEDLETINEIIDKY